MTKSTVYWFTGLAGAGKTTLGRLFYEQLKARKDSVVFCDGDFLREVFGSDLGYTREDRLKGALRNARLCKMLADQGIDVVCATISMLPECRRWSRENITSYREIYVKVPLDVLIQRDQKQLYSRALRGEIKDVVGIDIPIEEPEAPHLILHNDGSQTPEALAALAFQELIEQGSTICN